MKRYRLGKILGQGGMATVQEGWRQLASDTEQPIAIKRIRPEYEALAHVQERFHREARLCIDLAHPNLVKVYSFERNDDARIMPRNEPFIVMERIDGVSLARLGRQSAIPHPILRAILLQVLYALAYLHQRGIVHRDISPTNILVSHAGEVKVVDLGLATTLRAPRMTGGGFGNPPYACPEQIQGRDVDASADLYSLAAVTHELLTGSPPFGRGGLTTIGDRQAAQAAQATWALAPRPEAAPEDLRALLHGLLQPWATRAFRSADQAAEALEQYQQPIAINAEIALLVQNNMHSITETDLPWWPDPPPARERRRPVRQWLMPAMLLLGGVAAGLAIRGGWTSTDSPAAAPAAPGPDEQCTTHHPSRPARPPAEPIEHVEAGRVPTVSHPLPARPPGRGAARNEHVGLEGLRKVPITEKTPLSSFRSQEDQP